MMNWSRLPGGAIVQHDDGTYQVFKSYGNPDLFGESYKTLEEAQQAHANNPDNLSSRFSYVKVKFKAKKPQVAKFYLLMNAGFWEDRG